MDGGALPQTREGHNNKSFSSRKQNDVYVSEVALRIQENCVGDRFQQR
jgi:hypothetical protein